MISLQTNVDSLNAQRNLNLDNEFQSKTIQQLTSGYRINSSGDDAAGLAVANAYSSSVAELSQGVANANNGISQLQIVDGGLSNISTIMDRLKTLATQSASATFTGDRSTLNQEYAQLVAEISRQASNINLNAGGTFNGVLNVYIGGGNTSSDSSITVDLSGASNAVDATSLGLAGTNVLGGGVGFANNATRLDATGALYLTQTAADVSAGAAAAETFNFNLANSSGGAQNIKATVVNAAAGSNVATQGAGGISADNVLSQLNGQLNQYGITASIDSNGLLNFAGSTAFDVTDQGDSNNANATQLIGTGTVAGSLAVSTSASNLSNYALFGKAAFVPLTAKQQDTLSFQTAGQSIIVNLQGSAGDSSGTNINAAVAQINSKTAQYGLFALVNSAGTGIEFQSSSNFSVNSTLGTVPGTTGGTAPTVDSVFTNTGYQTTTAPSTGTSNNAFAAISAINAAIKAIGLVQGSVGAGENKLQYATGLAQSQIASFSAAESQIKDADIAAQAANLTKAQVLTQTSIAALAQANAEPQAVLKLLQQ